MTPLQLVDLAIEARERAYVPYSHFAVGAALLTGSGKVYQGCNIENSSFGATNCAERTAFFSAVYEGERDFTAIAVVGGPEGERVHELCPPCGICRQVMQEFSPEMEVICLNGVGDAKAFSLKELLPYGFDHNWLDR